MPVRSRCKFSRDWDMEISCRIQHGSFKTYNVKKHLNTRGHLKPPATLFIAHFGAWENMFLNIMPFISHHLDNELLQQ